MNKELGETIVRDAAMMMSRHPDWRLGQAVFNVALAHAKDRTNALRGTEVDPFYNDDMVEAFLDAVTQDEEENA